jgi:exodeoxyribonuclease VIII
VNARPPDTFAEYVALKATNWSKLKNLRDSPKHYRHRTLNPDDDSDTLRIGRAMHTLVLEPHKFEGEYVAFDGRRAGPKWDTFEVEHAHQTILTRKQWDDAHSMAAAILAHPVAAAYLARGEAEKTLVWTDPATGLACKCRVDFLSRTFGAVVDLKSAANIEKRAFENVIMRYGYNCQGAHYRNGAIACGEFVDPVSVIIAVEKTAPFDVGVFRLKPDAIDAGAADVADLLALLKQCTDRDEWPGRYPEEVDMGIPAWATMGDIEMSFVESEAS